MGIKWIHTASHSDRNSERYILKTIISKEKLAGDNHDMVCSLGSPLNTGHFNASVLDVQ